MPIYRARATRATLTKLLRVAVLAGPLAATALAGSPVIDHDAGYQPGDGTRGHVFAGYAEAPRQVDEPDRSVARGPDRWCTPWEVARSGVSPRTPAEILALVTARAETLVPGQHYALTCHEAANPDPYRVAIIVYHPDDPTQGIITTIEDVAAFARRLVTLDAPAVTTVPPPDRLVAGFATWVGPTNTLGATTRSAQVGTLWATATVEAEMVTYDPGDSSPAITCPAPATSWRTDQGPGARCGVVTWLDSGGGVGHFTLTATARGRVWLATSTDAVPRVVDTLTSPEADLAVTVRAIQAMID